MVPSGINPSRDWNEMIAGYDGKMSTTLASGLSHSENSSTRHVPRLDTTSPDTEMMILTLNYGNDRMRYKAFKWLIAHRNWSISLVLCTEVMPTSGFSLSPRQTYSERPSA